MSTSWSLEPGQMLQYMAKGTVWMWFRLSTLRWRDDSRWHKWAHVRVLIRGRQEYQGQMQRLEDATLLAPRRRGLSQARQAAERRREGKGEGKKHQCMVASYVSPTGDLVYNPGMCPDWESNQLPFGLQASAQSTEPHQPGLTTPLY